MPNLTHIGSIEMVTLLADDISNVPAKVDTGADSSSIWASNIEERDHVLSFILFDKNSPYFSGNRLSFEEYGVIRVRNSFGQTETRYKVALIIKLGGRNIKARFTLANRENNRYPILIGRRTISGKFLVDVTKSAKDRREVLVLSVNRGKDTSNFLKSVNDSSKKIDLSYATYKDLLFQTGPAGNSISLNDRDIASYDLLHFKTIEGNEGIVGAICAYLSKRNVEFIDKASKNYSGTSKLYQYIILTDYGLLVPDTIFMYPGKMVTAFDQIRQKLGLPFILKDIVGSKGDYNYLIQNLSDYEKAIKTADEAGVRLIAQKFIPNVGDYRVLVFGGQAALVISRARQPEQISHLNNLSKGATAGLRKPEDLPPEVIAMSTSGAKLLGRQIAGVDIVQDKTTGVWYCLEVNNGPQLATGCFVKQKQTAYLEYLERKLKK